MKNQIKNFLTTLKYHTVDTNIDLFDFLISDLFNQTLKVDTKLLKKDYNWAYKKMLYSCFSIFIDHVKTRIIDCYREHYSVDENRADLQCLIDITTHKSPAFDKPYYEEIYSLYNWWLNIRPIRIAIEDIEDYWNIKYNKDYREYPFLSQDEKNIELYNKNAEKYIGKGIYEIEDAIMLSRLLDIADILY